MRLFTLIACWCIAGTAVYAQPAMESKYFVVVSDPAKLLPGAVAHIQPNRMKMTDIVLEVAESASGKHIVGLTQSGLHWWDAKTGEPVRVVRFGGVHLARSGAVWLSAAGKTMELLLRDESILFDFDTFERLQSSKLKSPLHKLAISPDGTLVVSYAFSQTPMLKVVDRQTGQTKREIPVTNLIPSRMRISPNNRYLAYGGLKQMLIDLQSGEYLKNDLFPASLTEATEAFSPDSGRYYYINDKECWCHGLSKNAKLWSLPNERKSAFTSLAASPDGSTVALGIGGASVRLVDAKTGETKKEFPIEPGWAHVFYSRNSKALYASISGRLFKYSTETGERLSPSAHSYARLICFEPNGKSLRLTDDKKLVSHDWRSGETRPVQSKVAITDRYPSWSDDASWVVQTNAKGEILVSDVATGAEVGRFVYTEKTFRSSTSLSGDKKKLYARRSDGSGVVIDIATKKRFTVAGPVSGSRFPVSLSTTGRWLVAEDRTDRGSSLVLLQPGQDRAPRVVPEFSNGTFALSPDENLLAIAHHRFNDGKNSSHVRLVSLDTLDETNIALAKDDSRFWPWFSPNSRVFCYSGTTKSGGGRIDLIETATTSVRWTWNLPMPVGDGVFSRDSGLIASSTFYSTGYIFDVFGKVKPETTAWASDAEAGLWNDLASADARVAFQAMRRLVQHPKRAAGLLEKWIKPVARTDDSVQKWIDDLSSSTFTTRETARKSLGALGQGIIDDLRRAYEKPASLEARSRLGELLREVRWPKGDRLRQIRVIEVLEQFDPVLAAPCLRIIASGHPPAAWTKEAKAILER